MQTTTQTPSQPDSATRPDCAPAIGSVFELIEHQACDDLYYPLGIFLTLADAVATVEKHGVGVCTMDPDEWAGVEIKERRIGLTSNGRTVWKRSWKRDWSEDAKERWKIITPAQNTEASERGQKPNE